MSACTHTQTSRLTVGSVYLACECGAVKRRFDPSDTWHVCDVCRTREQLKTEESKP